MIDQVALVVTVIDEHWRRFDDLPGVNCWCGKQVMTAEEFMASSNEIWEPYVEGVKPTLRMEDQRHFEHVADQILGALQLGSTATTEIAAVTEWASTTKRDAKPNNHSAIHSSERVAKAYARDFADQFEGKVLSRVTNKVTTEWLEWSE